MNHGPLYSDIFCRDIIALPFNKIPDFSQDYLTSLFYKTLPLVVLLSHSKISYQSFDFTCTIIFTGIHWYQISAFEKVLLFIFMFSYVGGRSPDHPIDINSRTNFNLFCTDVTIHKELTWNGKLEQI
jgi:hypothetical protein